MTTQAPPTQTLNESTEKLIHYVKTYQSDTFDADASALTRGEAKRIVAELIGQIEDQLDGVRLTALLDEIREA